MKIAFVTPPLLQFNTPYPAGPMLTAFLQANGHAAIHSDLSIALIRNILSKRGLRAITNVMPAKSSNISICHFLKNKTAIINNIDMAVSLLRGQNKDIASKIAAGRVLPEGPRFTNFGIIEDQLPAMEKALIMASLFIDDISDAIRIGIDSNFMLAKYADHLAAEVKSFTPVIRALESRPTIIDTMIDKQAIELIRTSKPDILCMTIPFPGTFYGAMRIAQIARKLSPAIKIIIGGGYVNTELRNISDSRIFRLVDFIVYDDGEVPLLRILDQITGRKTASPFTKQKPANSKSAATITLKGYVRTKTLLQGKITDHAMDSTETISHNMRPAPTYAQCLKKVGYFAMMETPNPMHRLWSSRRWIKLQIAHGCYWHKCAFCDTKLDYINRFDPASPETVVRWMRETAKTSGEKGFHFVDEAAPPALLAGIAKLLIKMNLKYTWWANIRFEDSFTPALARLLRKSGCIALTGGLETSDDRLLCLMNKGVTLAQAARVTHSLSESGIMVHAYLMYGFPTQTAQDTVNALEYVRQLFARGCIQSAYWHRFALTVHSSMFSEPARFGISRPAQILSGFSTNESPFKEKTAANHEMLGKGLRKAVYNYMHGIGLDMNVQDWFDRKVPAPHLPENFATGITDGALHKACRTR